MKTDSWYCLCFSIYSDDDLIRSDDDDDERYFPSDEGDDYNSVSEGSGFSFGNEETKSRFTNYSMTSSVIRRNEGNTQHKAQKTWPMQNTCMCMNYAAGGSLISLLLLAYYEWKR